MDMTYEKGFDLFFAINTIINHKGEYSFIIYIKQYIKTIKVLRIRYKTTKIQTIVFLA